jgi:beta-lactam-binding protein with PASTA domain
MARRPVPADLEDALAQSPAARERFWSLPPEQVDRWVGYVQRARFPGARRRRVAEAVRRLGGVPTETVEQRAAVVALPREDAFTWIAGIALLAALAAFLVWLTVLRDDHHSTGTSAVVVTAKSTVPKVTGIRLESAQFQLKQQKLGVKVVRRTGSKPKGIVLAQAPKANARVVQGSTVSLVVSKGLPGVKVPKLVGLAAADAVRQLQKLGLSAALQQQPAKATPGSVVRQTPAAGKRAKKGTPVTLVVAKGAAAVVVPDVRGQSQQDAADALQQQGLNVRPVGVASSQPAGTVVAQSPAPQTKVQQGANVRINVAKQKPQQQPVPTTTTAAATTTTAPVQQSPTGNDYRGMRLQKAVQKIADGRQQVVVQYVTSSQPAGVVVANSNAGGKVKLQVSAGAHPRPADSVPDTTGEDEATAQQDLGDAGFDVITARWPVDDPANDGVVVFQTPGSAPQGAAVVLYVGSSS